jgi:hypothetical protein
MATTTISIDDALLEQVKQAAGEHLSEWIATACRSRLWADAARLAAEWERDHPEEAAAERAAEAVRCVEVEAEHEIQHLADEAARRRGGQAAEPTDADYAEAMRQVRDLLDRACRRPGETDADTD